MRKKLGKIWVGRSGELGLKGEVFRSEDTPTAETCKYGYVIGPFRTIRGAAWMAHPTRGIMNPHCHTVRAAEALAKRYAKGGGYDPKTRTWSEPDPFKPGKPQGEPATSAA